MNNQNYTDGVELLFFNPPGITEITPLYGPTTGDTVVDIYGNKFNRARDPICIFGGITVNATFPEQGQKHLRCISPPYYRPGEVELMVKYRNDKFHAGTRIYTYINVPVVDTMDPGCGPLKGYT